METGPSGSGEEPETSPSRPAFNARGAGTSGEVRIELITTLDHRCSG
jgi:hypothetical protein